MLINGSRLINCPVLSLHVGGEIARITEVIINPNNLKVLAFRVEGPLIRDDVGDILPIESVREFSAHGAIVDSIDEFIDGEEVVRIRDVVKLNFSLVGLKAVTKKKVKLGKVSDYILETGAWQVHQIIVQRPLIKSFLDPELIIPRQKIVEVNDYEIIIKDETEKSQRKSVATTPADFVPNFVNPFREPDFVSESKTARKS